MEYTIIVVKELENRPDWNSIIRSIDTDRAYVLCPGCEWLLVTSDDMRRHWQLGHFDSVSDRGEIPQDTFLLNLSRNIEVPIAEMHIRARLVQEDEFGSLYEPAGNIRDVRLLKVMDEQGEHWMNVPANTRTAKAGVAWSYSMVENEYKPILRT